MDAQEIAMPAGAVILALQTQNEAPCIWALVDAEEPVHETRIFRTVGTGHSADVASKGTYVGTYQIRGGQLVFHVFEMA